MKCPFCCAHDSKVRKTTRPIDEAGFAFGQLKRRDRECRVCRKTFATFEVQEDTFRKLTLAEAKLPRRRPIKTR
jgi:transcriptional regulator NrdR family protein